MWAAWVPEDLEGRHGGLRYSGDWRTGKTKGLASVLGGAGILGLAEDTKPPEVRLEPGSDWFTERAVQEATEAESSGLNYDPASHLPGNLGNPSLSPSVFWGGGACTMSLWLWGTAWQQAPAASHEPARPTSGKETPSIRSQPLSNESLSWPSLLPWGVAALTAH